VNRAQSGRAYLSGLRPWNGRGGFSLHELQEVLKRLDDPQDKVPTVHIAGTNGKGSVSAAISSILGQAGYRVGLNISPHLEKINERIYIDGYQCSDDFLGEFAYEIKQASNRALVDLSFHEAITAVAFHGLKETGVDWAVLEVGLGGRLDASNVISRPAATAIVTISYDHQNILGDTLGEIAAEKAGIIKPGSPLVTGILPKEADIVISNKASGVSHYKFGRDFDARVVTAEGAPRFEYWGKDFIAGKNLSFEYGSQLPGVHQGHNLAVAATLGLLVGCSPEVCKRGVEGVFWPGRLESIKLEGVELVIDCAHNIGGIRSLISFLESTGQRGIDLTFGVLEGKNWKEMVKALSPYVQTWRILLPDSERALPQEQLRQELLLSGTEVRVECYGSDYERCLREISSQTEGARAFVTGSMYMVGKLRSMLSVPIRPLWTKATEK
jgi:dihydrofolate synthase/folylpolyglutamate synthase